MRRARQRAASIARVTSRAEQWIAGALWLCAAGCGAAGCGGAGAAERTAQPNAVLAAWAQAVTASDAHAGWALLDERGRAGLDEARFAALFVENRADLEAQARAIAASAQRPITAQARLVLVDGEVVVLVLEEGAWRIDGGVLDAPGLHTPQDAVASLRRALQRRSLAGVLRVLARSTRGDVEAELTRMLDATEDPANFDLQVQGDSAEVRLTGGAHIRLVRESGEWRVVDVE